MLFTSVLLVLLVSSILLISHWSQNRGIVYLVVVLLLFTIRQFTFLLMHSDAHVEVLALLLFHFDPLIFLIGPFFFYYLKSLVQGKFVVDKYLLVYSLPALVILINTLPFYGYPFAEKVAESAAVQGNYYLDGPINFSTVFFPLKYQVGVGALFNLTITLFSFAYLIRLKKSGTASLKKKVSVLINRILVVIPMLIIPNLILIGYALINSPVKGELIIRQVAFEDNGFVFFMPLLLPLSFFLIPSWLYTDLEGVHAFDKIRAFLQGLWQRAAGHHAAASAEKSADLECILTYIETEKPYVKVDFSLHDISLAVNIPRIRVSNCFNKELNTSFPAYRNKLRVAHAISLLRRGAHLNTSIEGIAERSGFKSKSIFYAAFKEEYDMTPTEWMKKNLEVEKEPLVQESNYSKNTSHVI
jgi:AraC-like DNA-binding protein